MTWVSNPKPIFGNFINLSFPEGVLEDTLSPLIQSVHDTPLQENNKMRPKGHVAHLQLNNKCQRWFKQPSFSLFCIFAYIICTFFYKIETALYNPTSTLNSLLYMFYNNYLIKKTSIWNILRHFQSKIYLMIFIVSLQLDLPQVS